MAMKPADERADECGDDVDDEGMETSSDEGPDDEFDDDDYFRVNFDDDYYQYFTKSWLCDPNTLEEWEGRYLPKRILKLDEPFGQGSIVTLCVAPDDDAYADGIVISSLDSFNYFLDDFREQFKIENPDAKGVVPVTKAGSEKWKVGAAIGHDDDEAFVNRLADNRYVEFAKTFDFNRYGATATTFSRASTGVAEKYVRQTLEENAGETNTAVRLALYFERKAPEITSVTQILADQALFTVVRTNLGLPESFSMLDIDRQIEIFEERVDLEAFSDPEAVAKQIERFSALWDANNPDQTTANTIGLLFSNSAAGISPDLMVAIQTLKR